MKKILFLFILFALTVALLTACKKKKEDDINNGDCSTISSTFGGNIKPIIDANCLSPGCHNAGSSNGDLTTYNGIKAKADNGSLNNRVVQQKTMPPSGALSTDNLKKIKCWISSGSPNN